MDECDENLLQNETPFSIQIIDPLQDTQEETEYQNLKYKLTQLQKVVKSLSSSNQKFLDKIIELQDELDLRQNQNDYAMLEHELTHIQTLIEQYKTNLDLYESKNQQLIKQKDSEIIYLKQQIQKMNQNEIQFMDQLSSKEDELKYYIQITQRLQRQLQQSKYDNQNKKSKKTYDNSSQLSSFRQSYEPFNDKINQQLQILIEKLVKELEYERNHKRQFKGEIKKLQSSVLQLQKEINKKNNMIYSQEIKIVKLNQQNSSSSNSNNNYNYQNNKINHHNSNKTLSNIHTISQKSLVNTPFYEEEEKNVKYQRGTFHFKNNYNIINKINNQLITAKPVQIPMSMTKKSKGAYHQQTKILKQISLKQLIDSKTKLQARQKCILSLKIIDFLLNNTHNTYLSPQNLIIKNYNNESFSHCVLKVRLNDQYEYQNGSNTVLDGCLLIDNVVELVNVVMNSIGDMDKNFGLKSCENKMLAFVYDMNQNGGYNTHEDVQQLKNIIEEVIYQQNV